MRRIWRVIRTMLAAIGLVVVVCTLTPLTFWLATWLAGPWHDPKGDVLIVLGAEMEKDGFPGRVTFRRAMYAARVWREGGFARIVVCGSSDQDIAVARVMRDYLIFSGVPQAAIIEEPTSRSTRENALYAARILAGEPGTKVLLTSDYHMFRAHRAFLKAGLVVSPRPIPDIRSRHSRVEQRWALVTELIREAAQIGYYFARGWI
ncbi:MAG: YdcF family protein [Acidobacteria bacterium]|nr:YdcF family protein [Acidobacteriota bacterium]